MWGDREKTFFRRDAVQASSLARVLRFSRATRLAKPMVDYAPRVHQRRPRALGWGPRVKPGILSNGSTSKFAGRERRRDASPAVSKSQQKVVVHTKRTTGVVSLAASELVGREALALRPFPFSLCAGAPIRCLTNSLSGIVSCLDFWFLLTCLDRPLFLILW